MNEILLTGVTISKSLPLEKIAAFFKLHSPLKWKDYIIIQGEHLEMILKYEVTDQSVYIYDFGAITFVNLHIQSIKAILDYLNLIIGNLDYNLFMDSVEVHRVQLKEDGTCKLWPTSDDWMPFDSCIIPITAEIVSQSVAMENIELVLSELVDDTDQLLNRLERGKLKIRTRKMGKITTKIIRFQYDTINSIHIFDRPKFHDASIYPKQVHELLAGYYELYDRFHVIEEKSEDLLNMYQTYLELSNEKTEYRLYVLQAFLLILFPLKYFIGDEIAQMLFKIEDCFLNFLP